MDTRAESERSTQEEVTTGPVFTTQQRRDIVRMFLQAFMGGQIQIDHITKQEIEANTEGVEALTKLLTGDPKLVRKVGIAEFAQSVMVEFLAKCRIASGNVKARPEEIEEAIEWIFLKILALREGRRIQGEFLAIPNLESRLQTLEERVASLSELIEELRILWRALAGRSGESH